MWADSSPSNFIDCHMVQPALNPFLADIPGIHGADGREMLQMDRPLLRDVPYSESLLWRMCTYKDLRYPPVNFQILWCSDCTGYCLQTCRCTAPEEKHMCMHIQF